MLVALPRSGCAASTWRWPPSPSGRPCTTASSQLLDLPRLRRLDHRRELALPGTQGIGDRTEMIEIAVFFGACAIGVLALRRSAFGRRLVAMNDSRRPSPRWASTRRSPR